jgi:hypothetical protein
MHEVLPTSILLQPKFAGWQGRGDSLTQTAYLSSQLLSSFDAPA